MEPLEIGQITPEHIKEFEIGQSTTGLFVDLLLGDDNPLGFTEEQDDYIMQCLFDIAERESDVLYGLALNIAEILRDAPKESVDLLDVDSLCVTAMQRMKIGN